MAKVKILKCLVTGVMILKSNPLPVVPYALILTVLGSIAVLVSRWQGQDLLYAPASAWGFLMSFIYWTAETLILVGVCKIIWRPSDTRVTSFGNLIPDRTVLVQLVLFSLFMAVLTISLNLLATGVARGWSSHKVVALPVYPLVFYFLSMLPLMVIDERTTIMRAAYEVCFRLKHDWRTLLKLALVAESCFLIVGITGELVLEIASDILLIDHFGANLFRTLSAVINGAMVAVLYREMYGMNPRVTPKALFSSSPNVPQAHL